MSSYHYLYILRKEKDADIYSNQMIKDILKSHLGQSINPNLDQKEQEEQLNKTIESNNKLLYIYKNDNHLIDNKDNSDNVVLFKTRFSSSFDQFPNYYNLNSYVPERSQIIIPENDIRWIAQALNYLIYNHTSKKYDQNEIKVLNNYFIELFGRSLPSFYITDKINDDSNDLDSELNEEEEFNFEEIKRYKQLFDFYESLKEQNYGSEDQYIMLMQKF